MRAVAYCRISDDRAGSGLGVARQEADCRTLCEREGWDLVDVLVDNDRSAYRAKRRPGYERLCEGLKAGGWDVLVAWHPDRLTRHPKELEALIDVLNASGVHVRTVTAGEYDLTTAAGRMTARVVGAVGRHESEQKGERTRRKHRELAEAGKDAGGGKAFGWLPDRHTLDPVEAAMVREWAQRILDGGTLRGIVADLEASNVPTPQGKRWHSFVVRRILTAARTAGFRSYGGKLYPGAWEPILDEVTWRRLRAVLADPARRAATAPRAYLLTGGLAVCGLCGARLVARPKADSRRCYVCASPPMFDGCGKIRILAEEFEEDVQDRVLDAIEAGRVPAIDTADGSLLVEQAQTEARLAELADDYYVHRSITKAQFQSASRLLNAKASALNARSARLERAKTAPRIDRSVIDGWWGRSMEFRRGVIAGMVDRVVVNPAVKGRNFYDPARVSIPPDAWRC